MSTSFNIVGKLHKKFDIESKTPTFQVRDFVIEINENNYLNYIKFQITGDRCGIIDSFEEGTEINVSFDLRGREWNGKYFTNLNAWRVQPVEAGVSTQNNFGDDPFPTTDFPDQNDSMEFNDGGDEMDDLPF